MRTECRFNRDGRGGNKASTYKKQRLNSMSAALVRGEGGCRQTVRGRARLGWGGLGGPGSAGSSMNLYTGQTYQSCWKLVRDGDAEQSVEWFGGFLRMDVWSRRVNGTYQCVGDWSLRSLWWWWWWVRIHADVMVTPLRLRSLMFVELRRRIRRRRGRGARFHFSSMRSF